MTTFLVIVFAILFFVLIMASIALHEVGHLIPAKIFGVRVPQYFIGFGKTLWSTKRGETEYGIKAFPLGGFVRLLGMYPPERSGRKGWLGRMADDARSVEYEQITAADAGRLFHQKPVWQRIIVMLGGPAMNIFLAFVIFLGINLFHGTYQPTLVVSTVSDCIVPADREVKKCTEQDPPTPAAASGVRVGDHLVSFNGVPLTSWEQMGDLIRDNRDQEARVVVERDGQRVELAPTHTVVTAVADRLDPTKTLEAGFFGVSPTNELARGGVGATASQMWDMTKMSVVALASFPVRIWNVGVDLVTGQPRDVNSPISIVGASRVAGELSVETRIPVPDRAASWMSLLGSINLFVALLNLVPLVPLDGGHIAGAIYEWLRRGVNRLRGRPDPGAVDTARMLPVAYLVGGFLLLGGVVLILADIITPISLF
ncbi:M50 family metallopeptidase [Tessaracoccus antarcticus]|uniref:Peptidase n=1 Tax=Tessaracoccus antarcticus TaxID=2479848 RepID=A0A3M0GDU5_9ACTN|nr:site-2 protease family protein [Tessaracoccus antarcticus]RMB59773.1 peptidase [Tessaracoccus antarcticus]